MINDSLGNAANYFDLHPLLEKAFNYTHKQEIEKTPTGTTEVEGNHLKVSIAKTQLKPKKEARLESHRRYINIRLQTHI